MHCHAGCTGSRPHTDPTPVLAELGLSTSDLFDEQSHEQWRKVTNLTAHRARRSSAARTQHEVPVEQAPRVVPKPAKAEKAEPAGRPYVEAWHLYQHPDTLEVAWAAIRIVQPLADGGYDKSFFYTHRDDRESGKRIHLGVNPDTGRKLFETLPDGWASKLPTESRLQTLFHLGALRGDVAAGRTIYVTEGESDANAGRAAGLAATTAPKGAGKWQAHHSDELAGVDVVIVADCDDEGITGAETVARSLAGTASSIRVVQPREGKDLHDHLGFGYSPGELVDVDLGIPELQPATAAVPGDVGVDEPDTYADAPGPNIIDDPQVPNERPTFLIRNGEIVERTWRTDGRGEDKVHRARYKTVVGCAAWVTEITEEDNGDEDSRYVRPTRDQVWHLERRGTDGDVADEIDLRFPLEQIQSGEWLDHWPWPDTILGHKRSDRDRAKTAILQARQAPSRRTRVYTCPGWRHTDTGPIYVHGAGAIGRGGQLDVDVDLGPVLSRTTLPEPSIDAQQLRDAFFHGTDPLRTVPARIQAPLRGVVFATLAEPFEMVTHLEGPKATKKTALARQMLQHIAPGMRFSRGAKEMASGASDLSTKTGMARMLGAAKDVPLLIDDLAPDRGGAPEARQRLATLARQAYNRSIANKGTRKHGEIASELPPRCSLVTTGEIVADGSAGSRCFNITVPPGAVSNELIQDLEATSRVEARGLIGASYLQWVAERREELLAWREELRETYLYAWRASLQHLPYPSDILSRLAEACRDYTVGELFLLTFLRDRDAITEAEADEQWHWSIQGLLDAATAADAEMSDPAVSLIWTIKELLASGRGHLTDRNGAAPVVDHDLDSPTRYGYTAQQQGGAAGTADSLWRANGDRLGAVAGDRVYLNPSEVEFQARRHHERAERPWTETQKSLATALDARGWLATHTDSKGKLNRAVGRTVYGTVQRVWDIPRELLDGFGGDDHDEGDDPDGPSPLSPLLTYRPGWAELPVAAGDEPQADSWPAAAGGDTATTTQPRQEPGPPLHPVTSPIGPDGHEQPQPDRPDHGRDEPDQVEAPAPDHPDHGRALPDHRPDQTQNTANRQPDQHTPDTATPQGTGWSGSPTSTGSQPDHHSTTPTKTTKRGNDEEWTYRLAVVDVDAVYLPEPDGQVTCLPHAEPPTASDIATLGDAFGLGHGHYGVGHIYLSPRLSDHLGLVVDEDLTDEVAQLGDRPDLTDWRAKRNAAAAEQLARRGAAITHDLRQAGWQVDRIRPRFSIRQPDPQHPDDSARARVFTLVLEAYSYMWEANPDDPSGPDNRSWPLPDPDDEPDQYCRRLASRLGRVGDLLGVPWQSSAANTGAELVQRLPVRMKKDPDTGTRHEDWRRQGAEKIPDERLHAQQVPRQGMWEPHHKWSRRPGEAELAAASEVVLFDERASYLPRLTGLQFGYGEATPMETGELLSRLADGEKLYGMALLDLPSWDVHALPPPHPDMAAQQLTRRWTSLRTVWLLATMHKHSSYGPEHLESLIQEAWVFPYTHRLYGKWGERLRTARQTAEAEADRLDQLLDQDPDGQADTLRWDLADWRAVAAMAKNTYTGYVGKLGSRRVLRAGAERYQHHYRPLAQATIWGEQRVQGWIKLAQYADQAGVYPLYAAGTDAYGYLAPTVDGQQPQPDVDDGKYGKLRPKDRIPLTEHMRDQLRRGVDAHRVIDGEIDRLHREGDR